MAKSPEQEHPQEALGWAARDPSGLLSPFKFSRRATGEKDVKFKVMFCGICHSDLHSMKNEWGFSTYPLVPGANLRGELHDLNLAPKIRTWAYKRTLRVSPSTFTRSDKEGEIAESEPAIDRHEIVGEVVEVGSKVEKFKVGDKVGMGCLVGSCGSCDNCHDHLENYCPKMILTYGAIYHDGTMTYGGYSNMMVVNEHFAIKFPQNMPLDASAPLLCAGITVYSPIRFFGLDHPGVHLGVVGLGGLGHVAVKFAKVMGVKVTVISSSHGKREEALQRLGADAFLVSSDINQIQAAMGTMDGIIDTVSAVHPMLPLIGLLKHNGKLVLIGVPDQPLELPVFPLLMGRKIVAGSCIGGMKETQEMIDFAAKHKITADIEVISIDYLNTAMDRLAKGDVKYRFVIDIGNTLKEG